MTTITETNIRPMVNVEIAGGTNSSSHLITFVTLNGGDNPSRIKFGVFCDVVNEKM